MKMTYSPTLDEILTLAQTRRQQPRARVPRRARRPRDARLRVPEGRARRLLVPARVRRGRRAAGALQLHRHASPIASSAAGRTTIRPTARTRCARSRTSCRATGSRTRRTPRRALTCRASPAAPSASSPTTWSATSSRASRSRRTTPGTCPEALFMFVDSLLVFDHIKHTIKVVAHCRLDGDVEASYRQACWRIEELAQAAEPDAARQRRTRPCGHEHVERHVQSNVGHERYLENVEKCKKYIVAGDIIQVVPSQRLIAEDDRAPVLDLPRAAQREPVAVHVLPADGRLLHRRRLAGDAGARRGRHRRDAPDRRHDAPRARPGRGRRDRDAPARTTRRSAPSTSCSWTSAATTSAASASRAPSRCATSWSSSATRT